MVVFADLGFLLAGRVEKLDAGQIVFAHVLFEFRVLPVIGDGYEDRLRGIGRRVHFFQQGHFGPTVRTPGGPEDKNHVLSSEVFQFQCFTIYVGEFEGRGFRAGLKQIGAVFDIRILFLCGLGFQKGSAEQQAGEQEAI